MISCTCVSDERHNKDPDQRLLSSARLPCEWLPCCCYNETTPSVQRFTLKTLLFIPKIGSRQAAKSAQALIKGWWNNGVHITPLFISERVERWEHAMISHVRRRQGDLKIYSSSHYGNLVNLSDQLENKCEVDLWLAAITKSIPSRGLYFFKVFS